jgi:K+-transporting ATPase A subunit
LTVVSSLNLFGLRIGFSTIDTVTESNQLDGFGTGKLIWLWMSVLVALFVRGLVAGTTRGYLSKTEGGLDGFLS